MKNLNINTGQMSKTKQQYKHKTIATFKIPKFSRQKEKKTKKF